MIGTPRLSYWFSGAIALHLLLLAVFWQKLPKTPIAPPAAPSTRLSLGMAAALAGASSQSTTVATQVKTQPQSQQPQHSKPQAQAELQTKAQPKPMPQPQNKSASQNIAHVKTLTAQKTRSAPAKPLPAKQTAKPAAPIAKATTKTSQTTSAPTPQKIQRPASAEQQIAQAASQAGNIGHRGSQQSAKQPQETGQASQQGGQALSDQFDLQVRKHLLANQKTPRVLGRRAQGSVEVEFVIDRHGKLLRQNIGKLSRIREFDRAARALVASAAPYPKAPPQLTWKERSYRIVINYQSL
ncbi:MAG: TonB family protein [Vibrionaceae bacterium]